MTPENELMLEGLVPMARLLAIDKAEEAALNASTPWTDTKRQAALEAFMDPMMLRFKSDGVPMEVIQRLAIIMNHTFVGRIVALTTGMPFSTGAGAKQ